MARCINSDQPLFDSKTFYLNNGDLVVVKEGRKLTHYLVSSYLDPEEPKTATYCVLIQLETGSKLNRFPQQRTTNMKDLTKSINHSYFHKSIVDKNNISIVGRDFFDINIKVI